MRRASVAGISTARAESPPPPPAIIAAWSCPSIPAIAPPAVASAPRAPRVAHQLTPRRAGEGGGEGGDPDDRPAARGRHRASSSSVSAVLASSSERPISISSSAIARPSAARTGVQRLARPVDGHLRLGERHEVDAGGAVGRRGRVARGGSLRQERRHVQAPERARLLVGGGGLAHAPLGLRADLAQQLGGALAHRHRLLAHQELATAREHGERGADHDAGHPVGARARHRLGGRRGARGAARELRADLEVGPELAPGALRVGLGRRDQLAPGGQRGACGERQRHERVRPGSASGSRGATGRTVSASTGRSSSAPRRAAIRARIACIRTMSSVMRVTSSRARSASAWRPLPVAYIASAEPAAWRSRSRVLAATPSARSAAHSSQNGHRGLAAHLPQAPGGLRAGGRRARARRPRGEGEPAAEGEHLHDLELVHAHGLHRAETRQVAVHRAELDARIGEGAGRGDARGGRSGLGARGAHLRAARVEPPVDGVEGERGAGRRRGRVGARGGRRARLCQERPRHEQRGQWDEAERRATLREAALHGVGRRAPAGRGAGTVTT
jgi:hypothetical protein